MSTPVTRPDVTTGERAKLERAHRYQGIFARVAKKLGKSRQHVFRVATGERQSRPVIDALIAEIDRIERLRKEAA